MNRILLLAATLCHFIPSSHAFSIVKSHHRQKQPAAALSVISADDSDFDVDLGLGGVRLAQESAVVFEGFVNINSNDGSVEAELEEMYRYNKLTPVDAIAPAEIVLTGQGFEEFKDPGEKTIAEVTYAPNDAVETAIKSWTADNNKFDGSDEWSIHFAGGDDLLLMQVMESAEELVKTVLGGEEGIKNSKIKSIPFTSASDQTWPEEQATVALVKTPTTSTSDDATGVAKSLARGQVYTHEGKYWTVIEDDINTDVE